MKLICLATVLDNLMGYYASVMSSCLLVFRRRACFYVVFPLVFFTVATGLVVFGWLHVACRGLGWANAVAR
jgi:hypothetical protein